MGRKKIAITRLTDERNRQITFSKRKAGLLKKAYELSILCDVEIAVIMITSNSKLYQYASSNMNSILIRYTDFKDPDESKTNADILDDITKRERGGADHEESGEEESSSSQSFLLTPQTQENFRRIDKEFDHLLRTNQAPASTAPTISALAPIGSAPATIPSVMPVTVPVGYSPNTVQQQIQQHLQNQMETQKSFSSSASLSSGSLSSTPPSSIMLSPQSDLESSRRGHKSPTNMPPPLNTPTRLQTLRNQTLKLHLPGSGRNYISLPTGSSPGQNGGEEGSSSRKDDEKDGKEVEENRDESGEARPGSKPHLRVYIPGQKEFVPKTQEAAPMPQVSLTTGAGGGAGGGGGISSSTAASLGITSTTDSLTTPVLSLTTPTPNIFSSFPPILSSLMGEFPFNQATPTPPAGGGAAGGTGGGTSGDSSSAALVAFPVSIQPSATGGSGTGNLILQAQNMGQPFLLTPTYEPRQNPLFNSPSGYTPPTSGLAPSGLSTSITGLQSMEQLKQQYERTQQLIQQQLLYSQLLQHQQSKEGGVSGGRVSVTTTTTAVSTASSVSPLLRGLDASHDPEGRLGSEGSSNNHLPHTQYINGSDVMIGSHTQQSHNHSRTKPSKDDITSGPPEKKTRLDCSPAPGSIQ